MRPYLPYSRLSRLAKWAFALFFVFAGGISEWRNPATPPKAQAQSESPQFLANVPLSLPILPSPSLLSHSSAYPHLDATLNQLLVTAQPSHYAAQIERLSVTIVTDSQSSATQISQRLSAFEATLLSQYERWLTVELPLQNVGVLSGMAGIQQVQANQPILPFSPVTSTPHQPSHRFLSSGNVISQGVAASNANVWHTAGARGAGVKIAVIDYFQNYLLAQSVGELPADLSFYPDANSLNLGSAHGTAVAEILYDMAPDAQLTLSRPPSSCADLASLILQLASAGHQIISSSVGPLHCGAGDGNPTDDPVAGAVSQARTQYGAFFIQAAGNQANRHWNGSDAGTHPNFVSFQPNVQVNQIGYLRDNARFDFALRWNDWSTSDQDLALWVVRWDGVNWVVQATFDAVQNGSQPPNESGAYTVPSGMAGNFGIALFKNHVNRSLILDLHNYYADFQVAQTAYSLAGAATNRDVLSVAAVNTQAITYPIESFSSQGRTLGSGGTLPGGLPQPFVSGYSKVDTWIMGSQFFSGTSAAAPHLAGAAALVWSRFQCVNPTVVHSAVQNYLQTHAIDQGAGGYDSVYGYGRLYLAGVLPISNQCTHQVYLPLLIR